MTETGREVFKVVIRGSMQEVWNEITKTHEPIKCFFNNRMDTNGLKPGGKICMRSPDGKWTGVVGEILEFDPPNRFSHTFKFTHLDDPPCRVTYELREIAEGVEFTLIVDDMPLGTKTAKQMTQGGKMIVNTLKSVIETGRPSLGIRMLFGLIKVMAPFSPKKCRSENWRL